MEVALYRALFENAPVAIALIDSGGLVVDANQEMARLLGRDREALRTAPVSTFAADDDADRLEQAAAVAYRGAGHPVAVEHRYATPGGRQGWSRTALRTFADPGCQGWTVLTMQDLTRDQEALEEQRREAEQDALTGLLNRRGGDRRLTAALQRMVLSGPVAVIICDADGLKQVNDRWGHGAGDEALVDLARRLRTAVRAGDDVARMGGDEFIVVARVATPDEARAIADRCVRAVAEPGPAEEAPAITISAGVAVAVPGEAVDPGRLLAAADRALYEAKRRGGNRWFSATEP